MPDITENTPQRDLVISTMPFKVPAPYFIGHVLTENEASALNGLLAENLRNNFAAKIKKDFEAADEKGTERPSLETLQTELTAYAETYEFGVRRAGSGTIGTSTDPVERELNKMARELIKSRLKEKGVKLKSITEENLQELVDKLIAGRPALRLEAERRVNSLKELDAGEVDLTETIAAAGAASAEEPAETAAE